MYRPPNSGSDYWDLIEQTFDNLCDSHITDLVILGDFNSDLLKPMHANRIQNLTNSYNLHQLIDEPTHYTEIYSNQHQTFADDTILYKVVRNIDLAAAELNIDLESIKFWAKIWKVDFNPLKSKSLLITKNNQNIPHPPLIMSQSQIEEVN